MTVNQHVRYGAGEKVEITSKPLGIVYNLKFILGCGFVFFHCGVDHFKEYRTTVFYLQL